MTTRFGPSPYPGQTFFGAYAGIAIRRATTRFGGPLISGKTLFGSNGLGVFAWRVPAVGLHGPSFIWSSLSMPADTFSEVRGQITQWPSAGMLFAWEDGSFSFKGAPEGAYSFSANIYANGALVAAKVFTLRVLHVKTTLELAMGPGSFPQWRGEGPSYPGTKAAANSWASMLGKIAAQPGLK